MRSEADVGFHFVEIVAGFIPHTILIVWSIGERQSPSAHHRCSFGFLHNQ